MKSKIIHLQGIELPPKSGLTRRHVRKGKRVTPHYQERYDRQTLIYDCFFEPASQKMVFTAPRFLNLWFLLRKHLYIDGKKFTGKFKRQTSQRTELLEFSSHSQAELQIRHPDFEGPIFVRDSAQELFKNKNVMFAMNKNNDLEWIYQWALFHQRTHGLEGVVVVDNGSSKYSPEDIVKTLTRVSGLKSAAVVVADYPYGPVDSSGKIAISPRFLQTSMMNLVKNDLFRQARSVLSVDIDELVLKENEQTVFDAAQKSRLGAVSFREVKVYPAGNEEIAYPQSDHYMVKVDAKQGNTKWCVSVTGFINRFSWAVHRFGGGFFPFTETKDFRYLHCQSTSTSWKKNRYKKEPNLVEDENIRKRLLRVFERGCP